MPESKSGALPLGYAPIPRMSLSRRGFGADPAKRAARYPLAPRSAMDPYGVVPGLVPGTQTYSEACSGSAWVPAMNAGTTSVLRAEPALPPALAWWAARGCGLRFGHLGGRNCNGFHMQLRCLIGLFMPMALAIGGGGARRDVSALFIGR